MNHISAHNKYIDMLRATAPALAVATHCETRSSQARLAATTSRAPARVRFGGDVAHCFSAPGRLLGDNSSAFAFIHAANAGPDLSGATKPDCPRPNAFAAILSALRLRLDTSAAAMATCLADSALERCAALRLRIPRAAADSTCAAAFETGVLEVEGLAPADALRRGPRSGVAVDVLLASALFSVCAPA